MEHDNNSTKWHESAVAIVFFLVFGAVVTSPCWGFALFLAVTR
jgi:hypothetical protein